MQKWKVVAGFMLACGFAAAHAEDACTKLLSLKIPDVTLSAAQTVPAGEFKAPIPVPPFQLSAQLPAHCRVTGSIRPSADSDIRFEVWLPVSGWNHRYHQMGNGGLAGSMPLVNMIEPLQRGAAAAATDDGHVTQDGFDGSWAIGHPEKLIDYGYRAVHLTSIAGEAIVRAYYGIPPQHRYFLGCSDGGRESLMEAQRYPQDFDGYLVGAPGIDIPGNEVTHLHVWQLQQKLKTQDSLTAATLETLSKGVLARCDALDGVKDGVLRDPRSCNFKTQELVCKEGASTSCLTQAQAVAIQGIIDGPRDAKTGAQAAPGAWGTLGTEFVTWPGIFVNTSNGPSLGAMSLAGVIGSFIYGKPKLDMVSLDPAQVAKDAHAKLPAVINPESPDLRAAQRTGRKILHYHGWADPNISPQYSIDYYDAVQKYFKKDTRDFYRLFMVPGMAHCWGGVGATGIGGVGVGSVPGFIDDPQRDWTSALERWVEKGVAPQQFTAAEFKTAAPGQQLILPLQIMGTRPLCPYPQVASYRGSGSTNDAANFSCAAPPR